MTIAATFGNAVRNHRARPAKSIYSSSHYLLGIEFELESVARDSYEDSNGYRLPSGYDIHHDASLRDGIELVFDGPTNGVTIDRRVRNMEAFLADRSYITSERTSTHIHLNMSDDAATVELARTMFALTYMIEPAIFRFADENRKWCSYCQPISDMTQQRFGDIVAGTDRQFVSGANGSTHSDKYYGFNLKSLSRHGTIEFRYFPGWVDRATTNSWINLVMEIRLAAESIGSLDSLMTLAEDTDDLWLHLAAVMPESHERLRSLIEDVEISRRAAYVKSIREVHSVQPVIAPARISSVDPDSSMAAMLAAIMQASFTGADRAAEIVREVVSSSRLTQDVIDDLRNVLESSSTEEVIRLFDSAAAGRYTTAPFTF